MLTEKQRFGVIKPSKELRKLNILSAISSNPSISQRKLAQLVMVTSTMVNNYLRDLTQEQLVSMDGETNRTIQYHITEKGATEKAKLLNNAWKELIQMYGVIKQELRSILTELKKKGVKELALFGAAETGELVCQICSTLGIKIEIVLDSDRAKWGSLLLNTPVRPPTDLVSINCKDILITSMGYTEEIRSIILNSRPDISVHTLVKGSPEQN